jgi:hypothetical protein
MGPLTPEKHTLEEKRCPWQLAMVSLVYHPILTLHKETINAPRNSISLNERSSSNVCSFIALCKS